MPIQGFVKSRKHQFGRQGSLGTVVAAKRAYPLRGVPDPNLNWTDPDVDTGAIDPVASPVRGIPEMTAALTDNGLKYNNLPIKLSAIFGGGVTPSSSGTARIWDFDPASEAPLDDPDYYTYEFGDDVTVDWYQFGDSVLDRLEITGPDGGAALTASETWRLGSFASGSSTDSPVTGTVPTPDLTAAPDDVVVYLKDASIFIADDFYDLDGSQITNALHSFVLRITQARDPKRYADGTQSFDIAGYGLGARTIELECTFAKTEDTVGTGSQTDKWTSDVVKNTNIRIVFESIINASTGPDVPYSWSFELPCRYYTRQEGNIAGNTVIVLTAHAYFEPDNFGGVFRSTVTNTLSNGDL